MCEPPTVDPREAETKSALECVRPMSTLGLSADSVCGHNIIIIALFTKLLLSVEIQCKYLFSKCSTKVGSIIIPTVWVSKLR